MSAASDLRYWLENTPAGRVLSAYGVPERRSMDDIDRDLEMVNAEYRHRFGRDLTDQEKATVRVGASMRGGPVQVYGRDGGELGLQELHDLGFGIGIPARHHGQGIAIRSGGEWSGDPEVAQRAEIAMYGAAPMPEIRGVPGVS